MQGLQVWNENSEKTLDTSTRTLKIIGDAQLTYGSRHQFTSDLFLTETPFFIIIPSLTASSRNKINISFVGDKCSIYCGYRGVINNIKLIVGVY